MILDSGLLFGATLYATEYWWKHSLIAQFQTQSLRPV